MTTQDMLDERYGRRRSTRSRVTAWVVGGGIAAIVVLLFAWMTISNSANSIDATTTAFHLEDARSATLNFQLTSPQGQPIACALEAQDEEHGVVGWKIVEYPPSEDHTRAFAEVIPTVGAATTVLVNSCWVT